MKSKVVSSFSSCDNENFIEKLPGAATYSTVAGAWTIDLAAMTGATSTAAGACAI